MAELGNPKNTIEVLQKYQFHFAKKFGQNFLIDTHVLDKIVRAGNTGVIHCYSYAAPMAKEYISMGFFIGIGGVLTFKNARVIKEVASEIPLSSIVLETDSPYLAPVPYRGKRNNSMYLKEVVKQLAQIKQVSEETVITTTLANAKRLYRLEENCG